MTTYSDALTAMKAFFNTGWADQTPVVWGMDDAAEPADDKGWVRFGIQHTTGSQTTMGCPTANRFRHIGLITLQVFTPEGNYGIINKALVNDALELYQGADDSGIHYYNVRANEIGNDGFGWYQTNVIIEFRYDNIT